MLEVLRVVGPAWVQDLGRPRALSLGLPEGGALHTEALMRANAHLGNSLGAAGIEFFGQIFVSCTQPIWVATSEKRWRLRSSLNFCSRGGPSYLAVAGGLDVPIVFGGRGTLLGAGLGGWQGRALQAGDVLPVGQEKIRRPFVLPPLSVEGGCRFVPGPDPWPLETLQNFIDQTWVIQACDRSGYCLGGEALPSPVALGASAPMVCGAIQLPPGGLPVVLGPDHPVTGGYPLLGVLLREDRGRFFGRGSGGRVRFWAVGGRPTDPLIKKTS